MKNQKKIFFIRAALLTALFYCIMVPTFGQEVEGLQEFADATRVLKDDYRALTSVIAAIGAISGLVGGVRIYSNWNSGQKRIDEQVIGWFGACLFLQLVAVVVGAMFGM